MGILQPQQQPQGQPPMGQRPPMQQPQAQPPMGQRPPSPPMGGQGQPPMRQQGQPPIGNPPMKKPPMGRSPMDKPTDQKGGPEDFNKFVTEAIDILHQQGMSDVIVKRISDSKKKIEEIGKIALQALTGIMVKAQKAGAKFNAKILIQGLNIIVGEIITIAEAAGMEKASTEQRYQAFSYALSKYLKQSFREGKFSKEELVQAAKQLSQRKSGKAITKNMGNEAAPLNVPGEDQIRQGQPPQGQRPPAPPIGQQGQSPMGKPPMPPQGAPPIQQPPQGILSQGQRRM